MAIEEPPSEGTRVVMLLSSGAPILAGTTSVIVSSHRVYGFPAVSLPALRGSPRPALHLTTLEHRCGARR